MTTVCPAVDVNRAVSKPAVWRNHDASCELPLAQPILPCATLPWSICTGHAEKQEMQPVVLSLAGVQCDCKSRLAADDGLVDDIT